MPVPRAWSPRRTAVVAGGGLAGISAACELADAGYRVTLLERRPFLGGRSYSYTDKETGATVDNGQHVFLGCCTEYIRLLERLGVRDRAYLQKRLRVPVVDKVWGTSVLAAAGLPPPMHLLPSLLRFKPLSPAEKAAAAWAFAHIQALDRSRHPELDGVTFAEWLREKRQSPHAIRSLWNLITLPTLNGDISEVNADLALMVFQEGFLRSRTGANVGWSKVGLSELIGDATGRYLADRGGEVRLGEGVRAVETENGAVSRILTDAGEFTADAYILALDPGALPGVLPAPVRHDPFFARIQRLEPSPIVNLHLWYTGEEPPWPHRFAAFLNTPVQWLFNKSRLASRAGDGVTPTPVGARHAAPLPRHSRGLSAVEEAGNPPAHPEEAAAVSKDRPARHSGADPRHSRVTSRHSRAGGNPSAHPEVSKGERTYLDISLSGANQWLDIPNAELVALFTKELWSLLPGLRGASLDRALVVKQRHATFAAHPGVAALRPPQRTPVRGLYLAGDYTQTGWPATMESAVRSGVLAARAVTARQGRGMRRRRGSSS
jgi:squalene-associated FAD-dependent desaturase